MNDSEVCYFFGPKQAAEEQYAIFKKVLGQLQGGDEMLGDLTGKWVIFAEGYVYGLASYHSANAAINFAKVMRTPGGYVVALVDMDKHDVSPLEILAFGGPPDGDIPNH
jgi:hypothetical protein